MNKKITELEEKFIIYYETENIAQIYSTPTKSITIDEFNKYNVPCKECLVQSMCITEQNNINNIFVKEGIKLQLCENIKRFININDYLFNKVKYKKGP